jgi:plastocyanin
MTTHLARQLLHPLPVVALAAALAIGAAGCGDDKGSNGGEAGTQISIKDFTYSPDPLVAKVGDTITVTNNDGTPHTLTADDGSVTTGDLEGSESGRVKLAKAGTLTYHCEIHGQSMKGSIKVSA